jgi:ferric-dicitrate binding protein FerR (iron transport regulator)
MKLIGEALFEVARDEAHPFLVITNQYDIQVLGTRFIVFAYEGQDVKTSLVEGSVKTFMKDDASVSASLVPNESVEVKDGEFVKGSFSRSDFLSWKEGIYSFDDVPFSEIVSRLKLYFGIPIVINNDNLVRTVLARQISPG